MRRQSTTPRVAALKGARRRHAIKRQTIMPARRSDAYCRTRLDGTLERFCTTCHAFVADFTASSAARRLRQCAPCCRRARVAARHAARATTIAATVRRRERRAGRVSHLQPRDVAALLRVSRDRSAWRSGATGDLTIDRIDAGGELNVANAVVLATRQVRMRRAARDPMPAHVRELALVAAHAAALLAGAPTSASADAGAAARDDARGASPLGAQPRRDDEHDDA
jgi:hypothetical protein